MGKSYNQKMRKRALTNAQALPSHTYHLSMRKRRLRRYNKTGMNKVETRVVRELSQLVPDRMRIPMHWHDIYNLAYTYPAANQKQYSWRLNSPYDPDQPLGIGQRSAYGLTAMGTFYGRYRCFGSKIRLKIGSATTGTSSDILCALYPSDNIINITSDPDVKATAEKPYAKYQLLNTIYGNGAQKQITHYASVKKLEGISSIEFEDNFSANTGGDPADVFYWNFAFGSISTVATTYNLTVDADIIFYCEFFSRNNLAP